MAEGTVQHVAFTETTWLGAHASIRPSGSRARSFSARSCCLVSLSPRSSNWELRVPGELQQKALKTILLRMVCISAGADRALPACKTGGFGRTGLRGDSFLYLSSSLTNPTTPVSDSTMRSFKEIWE